MAKSVRQGVFETNSSTQHSLTFVFEIKKEDVKNIIGSDIIQFGVRTEEEISRAHPNEFFIDCDNTFTWQDRADLLFWKLLRSTNIPSSMLLTMETIRRVFEECGVRAEFLISKNFEYIKDEFTWMDDGDSINSCLLDYTDEDFENHLLNFIFSDHILEYSFADDCISWQIQDELQKEYNRILNTFPENSTGFQKFDR